MQDNLLNQNNLIKRFPAVTGATGLSLVAASADYAFGVAELTVSVTVTGVIGLKIGSTTVLQLDCLAHTTYHLKFYERVLLEATPAKSKAITLVVVGGGTLYASGVYVQMAKV